MKKISALMLALALITLTACGSKTPARTGNFDYKVGTASYTHTNDSYGYTEGKNGRGAVSTTLVAAVFDKDGKIVRISIDEVESNIGFDATGQLADFTAGEVQSKKELGDAYGMKAASSIGKEWYQQIESLEKWLEGRDVNVIVGGAAAKMGSMLADNSVNNYNSESAGLPSTANSTARTSSDTMTDNSGGMMSNMIDGANSIINDMTDGGNNNTGTAMDTSWMDEDLKASVTIDTSNIQRAIEKAYRNAK